MKNLIVYFSRAGENYCNGAIKVIQKGNTAVAAEFIRDAVGGDMFEIKTKKIYSDNYYKCIEQAKEEMQNGERPELQTYPGSVDGYDTVFLCYPNWFGTMPMAVYGFMERYDWSGKTIASLCTNEGSGMGASESALASVCKGAAILKGLSVHGSDAHSSGKKIAEWAKNAVKQ